MLNRLIYGEEIIFAYTDLPARKSDIKATFFGRDILETENFIVAKITVEACMELRQYKADLRLRSRVDFLFAAQARTILKTSLRPVKRTIYCMSSHS